MHAFYPQQALLSVVDASVLDRCPSWPLFFLDEVLFEEVSGVIVQQLL